MTRAPRHKPKLVPTPATNASHAKSVARHRVVNAHHEMRTAVTTAAVIVRVNKTLQQAMSPHSMSS